LALSQAVAPDSEIARKLQVSVQEWRDSNLAAQNRITLSLDTTIVQHVDYPQLSEVLLDLLYCRTATRRRPATTARSYEPVGRKEPDSS